MNRGWSDPFTMLDLEETDSLIAQAVVDEANRMHVEEWQSIVDALAIAVANGVARAFGA